MNILFIHQNFPGQFRHLAPWLVDQGHTVAAMRMQKAGLPETEAAAWQGGRLLTYSLSSASSRDVHPWLSDFEAKTIRA